MEFREAGLRNERIPTEWHSTGHSLGSRLENMIRQSAWFQCAQDVSGLRRLSGSSMSNYQILACLYVGLIGHDAVFWYTYAVQTGADGT